MTRVLTALALLPVVIGILLWGTPAVFGLLIAAVAVAGVWEMAGLAAASGFRIQRLPAAALAVGACAAFLDPSRFGELLAGLLVAVAGWVLLRTLADGPRADGVAVVAGTLFAGVYPGVFLAYLVGLRTAAGDAGVGAILFLASVIWIGDTFAYYGGRAFGRHPLAPVASPKKTIEGALFGIGGAVLAALGARALVFPQIGFWAVPVGLGLGILGILGDLVESILKRGAGVKDTATTLPGHGGFLDRLDSLLLAAPAFYYYYQWALR